MRLRVVAPVTVQRVGSTPGPAGLAGHRRDVVDQAVELSHVMAIGTGGPGG